jgi:hypothetical protein
VDRANSAASAPSPSRPAGIDQSDITTADTEHREAADALLVGRNTFESFRGFWPQQTDDPTGVSDYLNAVNKYVVSSTLDDPGWENSTVLRGPVIDEVRKLKEEPGRNKYRLFVFPVVVGRGARQFATVRFGRRAPAIRGSRASRRCVELDRCPHPEPTTTRRGCLRSIRTEGFTDRHHGYYQRWRSR